MSSISTFFSVNCNCRPTAALPRALCLIPLVGSVVQFIQERSIASSIQEISFLNNKQKIIDSINLKNEYKMYSMGRAGIILAATITALVLGILSPLVASLSIACLLFLIGLNAWTIYQNKKSVELLNNSTIGFAPIQLRLY